MLVLIYRKLKRNPAESLHSLKAWLASNGEIVESAETATDVLIIWRPKPTAAVSKLIALNESLSDLELQKMIPIPAKRARYKIYFSTVQRTYHRVIIESGHPPAEDEAQRIIEQVWRYDKKAKMPAGVKLKDAQFNRGICTVEGPDIDYIEKEG